MPFHVLGGQLNRKLALCGAWRTRVRGAVLAIACGLGALVPRAAAQELSALGGVMGSGADTSYAWQLDFRQHLGDWAAWSASWLNEGHAQFHHRDGAATQFWLVPIHDPLGLSLAVGVGAYRYADTHFLPHDGYENLHGWAPIYSASATYYFDSPWFARATLNMVPLSNGFHSDTLVVGVGYRLGWTHRVVPRDQPRQAVSVLVGRTVVNSRSSPHARAMMVEYRRLVHRHLQWSASFIHEGDPAIARRDGIATELWLTGEYLGGRLGLSFGAGPYLVFRRQGPRPLPNEIDTAAIAGPALDWLFAESWGLRIEWDRVFSHANRDADVFGAGVSYRWGR